MGTESRSAIWIALSVGATVAVLVVLVAFRHRKGPITAIRRLSSSTGWDQYTRVNQGKSQKRATADNPVYTNPLYNVATAPDCESMQATNTDGSHTVLLVPEDPAQQKRWNIRGTS